MSIYNVAKRINIMICAWNFNKIMVPKYLLLLSRDITLYIFIIFIKMMGQQFMKVNIFNIIYDNIWYMIIYGYMIIYDIWNRNGYCKKRWIDDKIC